MIDDVMLDLAISISLSTGELLLISKLLLDCLCPLLIFVANAFEYGLSLQYTVHTLVWRAMR
jgi:hypothetical protein